MCGGATPNAEDGSAPVHQAEQLQRSLKVATWNIAAVNNNPFEYWITHDDPRYAELMVNVEAFLEQPDSQDVPVCDVVTDAMFEDLLSLMGTEGWAGLDELKTMWVKEYRSRRIVSEFMKDKSLGAKRLASMPDRITNTIHALDRAQPVCRPTVINHYTGNMSSVSTWWDCWKQFMFQETVQISSRKGVVSKRPCEMLTLISKSKYPAITEEEERISIPLQCLCQAIFDAILVHMMTVLSPDGNWQVIKESICEATFRHKDQATLNIMRSVYGDMDVVCLQEASAKFAKSLKERFDETHHIVVPAGLDAARDQNSLILLKRELFLDDSMEEITDEVVKSMGKSSIPVEGGDLLAIVAKGVDGFQYVFASFHGDTNGLVTKPVLDALDRTYKAMFPRGDARLVFCLDANTYLEADKTKLSVNDFMLDCDLCGMRTCWPKDQDWSQCFTTYNARTFLQPQLNKACKSTEKQKKGDCNPKDHIVFYSSQYTAGSTVKDNTGQKTYVEGMCFPTLTFPSDHAVLSTTLIPECGVAAGRL